MGKIEQFVEINAPIETCYKTWTRFEDLPNYMTNILQVRRKGDPDVWHWQIKGPDGQILQWDVEIMGMHHRNNIISWHTVRDADICHAGAIILEKVEKNGTRLNFKVEYDENSPMIKTMALNNSKYATQIIMENLKNFKNKVESQQSLVAR